MMQIVTKKASTSAAIAARKTTVASRSANALPALNARRNLSTVSKRMNKVSNTQTTEHNNPTRAYSRPLTLRSDFFARLVCYCNGL